MGGYLVQVRMALHKYAKSVVEGWLGERLKDHPVSCDGFFNVVPSVFRAWNTVSTQHVSDE